MKDLEERFLESIPEISWFIVKYFGNEKLRELIELAQNRRTEVLRDELNDIWYELPDNQFNIRVNPPGWSTFLSLIEE